MEALSEFLAVAGGIAAGLGAAWAVIRRDVLPLLRRIAEATEAQWDDVVVGFLEGEDDDERGRMQ